MTPEARIRQLEEERDRLLVRIQDLAADLVAERAKNRPGGGCPHPLNMRLARADRLPGSICGDCGALLAVNTPQGG